jgi:hypothetical protein
MVTKEEEESRKAIAKVLRTLRYSIHPIFIITKSKSNIIFHPNKCDIDESIDEATISNKKNRDMIIYLQYNDIRKIQVLLANRNHTVFDLTDWKQ